MTNLKTTSNVENPPIHNRDSKRLLSKEVEIIDMKDHHTRLQQIIISPLLTLEIRDQPLLTKLLWLLQYSLMTTNLTCMVVLSRLTKEEAQLVEQKTSLAVDIGREFTNLRYKRKRHTRGADIHLNSSSSSSLSRNSQEKMLMINSNRVGNLLVSRKTTGKANRMIDNRRSLVSSESSRNRIERNSLKT